jgi:hypothetical protein
VSVVVARAKKPTKILYQISTRNTIVPDFYEEYYCTRFLQGILLYQISMINTFEPDSTGQKNLQYSANIGTKSPLAMMYTNSYDKSLGLSMGHISQCLRPKKEKFFSGCMWGCSLNATTNAYLNLVPKTPVIACKQLCDPSHKYLLKPL